VNVTKRFAPPPPPKKKKPSKKASSKDSKDASDLDNADEQEGKDQKELSTTKLDVELNKQLRSPGMAKLYKRSAKQETKLAQMRTGTSLTILQIYSIALSRLRLCVPWL
jgi:hypothetical protein